MSRRHAAEKREVLPDAKYGDRVLTKFRNNLMIDGKKSVAERIVYNAFDRHLIGRTTHPAGANLNRRFDVVERFVEHFDRCFFQAIFNPVERIVDDAFCDGLLPSIIRLFMNLVRTRSPNLASGRTSRFSAA